MFDKKSITQLISVVNRRKERKMNDYWNYLAHGELGKERKGHKYEPIYQANKAYESASRILSNGRKWVQSLFKRN